MSVYDGPIFTHIPHDTPPLDALKDITAEEWDNLRESNRNDERTRKYLPRSSLADHELQKVDRMDGRTFERWCAALLCRNGFHSVEVTPRSRDQGVDITAEKDGIKYAVQCKRYASDLGNTPIQEVSAGKNFYHCHIGVVMTNRFFTSGAKKLAEANGVLLWDRNKITDMLCCGGVFGNFLPNCQKHVEEI